MLFCPHPVCLCAKWYLQDWACLMLTVAVLKSQWFIWLSGVLALHPNYVQFHHAPHFSCHYFFSDSDLKELGAETTTEPDVSGAVLRQIHTGYGPRPHMIQSGRDDTRTERTEPIRDWLSLNTAPLSAYTITICLLTTFADYRVAGETITVSHHDHVNL